MDRFKFRIYCKESKKLIIPSDKPYKNLFKININGMLEVFDTQENFFHRDLTNRYIIEQCTGLKDENGSLIFAGDIIRTDLNVDYLVCDSTGGSVVIPLKNADEKYNKLIQTSLSDVQMIDFVKQSCEITGNIHDE